MSLSEQERKKRIHLASKRALQEAQERQNNTQEKILPKEINGVRGKEPTRFNDWEKKGIAYDF